MLALPQLNNREIEQVLQQDLPALDSAAAAFVQSHLAGLGEGAEPWVAEGMAQFLRGQATHQPETCPFCVQPLDGSSIINHYRSYFSEAYAQLKNSISANIPAIDRNHGGDLPAAFERAIRVAVEQKQFWSRFCDTPPIALDTAAIVRDWRIARDAVRLALITKQATPLEPVSLSAETQAAIATYEAHRQSIATLNHQLQQANIAIAVIREQAITSNPAVLASDIKRLKAVKARHTYELSPLCNDYIAEQAAKAATEQMRDQAKAALEQYRRTPFRDIKQRSTSTSNDSMLALDLITLRHLTHVAAQPALTILLSITHRCR